MHGVVRWRLIERVYRSIGKTAFGDDPVNYDVFMGVLGGLNRASPSVWPIVIRGWLRLLLPIVEATTQPFAQAIRDLASDHIVAGRVVIIGDAAAIPRPHTAASTSKAAANALGLADELQASTKDVPAALAHWEPPQAALGKYLRQQGSQTGDYCFFTDRPLRKLGDHR